jgi:hypothetical protein
LLPDPDAGVAHAAGPRSVLEESDAVSHTTHHTAREVTRAREAVGQRQGAPHRGGGVEVLAAEAGHRAPVHPALAHPRGGSMLGLFGTRRILRTSRPLGYRENSILTVFSNLLLIDHSNAATRARKFM